MQNLDDFILVEHKAGNREPQKVKKFRTTCDTCSKDMEYKFKMEVCKCRSCSIKEGYRKGRAINQNDTGLKATVKHPVLGELDLKSSYELFYYKLLRRRKAEFSYEPKAFPLSDGSSYRPDFYNIRDNVFIEVKGFLRTADKAKIEMFKAEYPNERLEVLTEQELLALGYKNSYYKKQHIFNVLGTPWRVRLMDFKEFARKCGTDAQAITETDVRCIYFNIRDCNVDTIRHELVHAYACMLNLTELQLDDDQIEEFFAELFGKYGKQLVSQAEDIHKLVLQLRRRIAS